MIRTQSHSNDVTMQIDQLVNFVEARGNRIKVKPIGVVCRNSCLKQTSTRL